MLIHFCYLTAAAPAATTTDSPTSATANSPTPPDGATNTHTATAAASAVYAVAVRWRQRHTPQHRSAAAAGVRTKCDSFLPTDGATQLRTLQFEFQFGLLKFVEKLRKLFGLRVKSRPLGIQIARLRQRCVIR